MGVKLYARGANIIIRHSVSQYHLFIYLLSE